MMGIQVKRVYDPIEKQDGVRVLVDRIWPRGITKERLKADLWLKDAAPSTALRKWFSHDRSRWDGFMDRYFSELDAKPEVVRQFLEIAARGPLTLLFSSKNIRFNQAVALKEYLISMSNR